MDLSVIIPAYNESARIEKSLRLVSAYFDEKDLNVEILVVDDGSTDDTVSKIKALGLSRVKLLSYPQNRGKGYAVKYGILASQGKEILLTDADLSTPVYYYDTLQKYLKTHPFVIGSRGLKDSQVKKNWFRGFMGTTGNLIIQMVLPGIQDTQCGFKLFDGETGRQVFSMQQLDGFGFDFEILFIARKWGIGIAEVPVSWTHHRGSKVRVWDYFHTLRELGQVVWNHWRGAYRLVNKKVPA